LIGIRDLARQLGISIGTVSRALNDKADVNPQTRLRVREAAARLGYSPNQSGRSLRRGKTDLVGVIIPVGNDSALINSVFLSVLDGLRRKLGERRLDLAVFLHGQDEDAFGSLRRIMERGFVDGVIISDTLQVDPRIDYLMQKHRPFVAFGRSQSGGNHPWVDPDFEDAVEQAVAHLAERGHRRIALLLPQGDKNFLHLIATALRAALWRRGLPFDPEWAQRRPAGEIGGYEGGEALLRLTPAPTAILASEALQTVGLYRKLEEAGARPGRDISVLGLLPEGRGQGLSPALTSIVTDWTAAGAWLGEALIGALATRPSPRGKTAPKAMQVIIPARFLPGASVHRVETARTSAA
jgi:DNA-binding LacI/PurR family transcriptional regulator